MKSLKLVHSIIQSLEKEEKRYFKLQALSQGAREKTYLQLYDVIAKRKEFDADSLRERLRQEGFKGLHAKIPYLRDMIVKSLIAQHGYKTIDEQLTTILQEAKIMEDRGLMDRYKKLLTKAKKMAYQYERFPILMEILQKQIIYTFNHSKKIEKLIPVLRTELEGVKQKSNEVVEFQQILHSLYLWYRTKNRAESEGAKISESLFLDSAYRPASFQAKITCFSAKALIQRLVNKDLELSKQYYYQVVQVWDEYPHMQIYDPKLYQIHLSNYLNSCHLLNQYEQFPTVLLKMRSGPTGTRREEVYKFENSAYNELLYVMNNYQMNLARSLIDELKTGLDKYQGQLNIARELLFIYNQGVLNFALGEYDETIGCTNKIKGFRKKASRQDIHLFAKILYLMAFYEMHKNDANPKALEVTLLNAIRSVKRKGGLSGFEKIMIDLFNELVWADQDGKMESFQQTNERLQNLQEKQDIAHVQGMSEVSIWLESKLTERSFAEVLVQRAEEGRKR